MGKYKKIDLFLVCKKDEENFKNVYFFNEKYGSLKEKIIKNVILISKNENLKNNNFGLVKELGSINDLNFDERILKNNEYNNLKNKQNEKSKEFTLKQGLIELKKAKVKFTEENVLFVVKDNSGQLIRLEKGKTSAGLVHILNEHASDFTNKFKITEAEIPNFIKDVLLKSDVIFSGISYRNGIECLTKIYFYRDKYYVLGGIGTNGFISSFYPINEKEYRRTVKKGETNGKRGN